MKTLLDLHNQKSEPEKRDIKNACEAMYDQAVANHNGAVLGLMPGYCKMAGIEGLISVED